MEGCENSADHRLRHGVASGDHRICLTFPSVRSRLPPSHHPTPTVGWSQSQSQSKSSRLLPVSNTRWQDEDGRITIAATYPISPTSYQAACPRIYKCRPVISCTDLWATARGGIGVHQPAPPVHFGLTPAPLTSTAMMMTTEEFNIRSCSQPSVSRRLGPNTR